MQSGQTVALLQRNEQQPDAEEFDREYWGLVYIVLRDNVFGRSVMQGLKGMVREVAKFRVPVLEVAPEVANCWRPPLRSRLSAIRYSLTDLLRILNGLGLVIGVGLGM